MSESEFERLKVETDFGIVFQAMGLLQANRMPYIGREYYYPGEVPATILEAFRKQSPDLVAHGVKEVLFRFEVIDTGKVNAAAGLTKLVFEAELGPEWEEGLAVKADAGRNRVVVERVFVKIKDDLKAQNHPTFESILEPPTKNRLHGGRIPQEIWRARLWCKSDEFDII